MPIKARKLRPPVKWHRGKSYLADRIVALMPPHRVYVEPFIGGGSVLLNKPRVYREIAGDLNADLVHLWTVLRDTPEKLIEFARETPYTRGNFLAALRMTPDSDAASPTVWALRTLIVNRFSRGGLGKTFAWSERTRGGQPGDANAWATILEELPAVAERIELAEFLCFEGRPRPDTE